ncbi:MAG: hypothetical protein LAT62_03490 [Natronospirillum sp.]|uniref:hypothetical protein n=1 Tax=Natronospirillum sp. TaxID=2812955 RepID=UPI0025D50D66|nr:hypothetical protein [Natronospirillum sp.]MCH8550974.1 hypothetical protein [Natronospirillum sp.]
MLLHPQLAMRNQWLLTLCLAILLSAKAYGESVSVRYLASTTGDQRSDYAIELLYLALEKSGLDHTMVGVTTRMQQQRALQEVIAGERLDVMWTMTSEDREAVARPIRFPVYRGLIGIRLPLVTEARIESLASVETLRDLQNLQAGQGYGWPDTEILAYNSLSVITGGDYRQLFPMLLQNRFDYFPRSVLEIWAEAEAYAEDGIVVSPHLALHYPAAVYYFVAPDNDALAEAIENGLETALADGSLEALFLGFYEHYLAQARLDDRVILELDNPLLPADTPLDRAELWYRP